MCAVVLAGESGGGLGRYWCPCLPPARWPGSVGGRALSAPEPQQSCGGGELPTRSLRSCNGHSLRACWRFVFDCVRNLGTNWITPPWCGWMGCGESVGLVLGGGLCWFNGRWRARYNCLAGRRCALACKAMFCLLGPGGFGCAERPWTFGNHRFPRATPKWPSTHEGGQKRPHFWVAHFELTGHIDPYICSVIK